MARKSQPNGDTSPKEITVEFPYEIVRNLRSQLRKTGTVSLKLTLPRAKTLDGDEVAFEGIKRDRKTRAARGKMTVHYTKPLAESAGDDE